MIKKVSKTLDVAPSVWRGFKVIAAQEGITLGELLERWVKEHEETAPTSQIEPGRSLYTPFDAAKKEYEALSEEDKARLREGEL